MPGWRPIAGALMVGIAALTGCSSETVDELEVGTCVNLPDDGQEDGAIPTMDCSEAHDGEVILSMTLSGSFDKRAIDDDSYTRCLDEFEEYVGADIWSAEAADFDLVVFTPTEQAWRDGGRHVLCVVTTLGGEQLTDSVKDSLP